MEQSHAQREPEAHEEVLDVVREDDRQGPPHGVRDLCEDPVDVQEGDGAKGQREAADLEDGDIAVEPAEEHAGEDERRP